VSPPKGGNIFDHQYGTERETRINVIE